MVVGKKIVPFFLVGESPGDMMKGDILGIRMSSMPPLPKGEFINVAEVGRPWLVMGNPPMRAWGDGGGRVGVLGRAAW